MGKADEEQVYIFVISGHLSIISILKKQLSKQQKQLNFVGTIFTTRLRGFFTVLLVADPSSSTYRKDFKKHMGELSLTWDHMHY